MGWSYCFAHIEKKQLVEFPGLDFTVEEIKPDCTTSQEFMDIISVLVNKGVA